MIILNGCNFFIVFKVRTDGLFPPLPSLTLIIIILTKLKSDENRSKTAILNNEFNYNYSTSY